MSKIRDRVKKKLSWVYTEIGTPSGNRITYLSPDEIEQILSIPEIAVVDRDAELPRNPYRCCTEDEILRESHYSYKEAQNKMLKAGYVKEIKE